MMTSGAEILATKVATSLAPERFERFICSTRASDAEHVAAVEALGVHALALDRRSRLDLPRWRPLLELLVQERIDVIHSHKFGSSVWAALLSRAANVPVLVAHEHSRSYDGQLLRQFLDRELIARFADVFLSTSREDRRRMVEVEGVDSLKARYLPNGIPRPPAGDGDAVRRELGLAPDAMVIGTVCGLRSEKALEVLLDALAIVVRDFPTAKGVIVGDGPERARLERHASDLELDGSVMFVGAQPHVRVPDFVAAFDIAVSSSDFEGGPLAVLEFMAAGKPVVATSVGGVRDLIEPGVHGLLVPPRDPPLLAAAMLRALEDRELRVALGSSAHDRQQRDFDLQVMVERLETLYESLYWASERGRRELVGITDDLGVRVR